MKVINKYLGHRLWGASAAVYIWSTYSDNRIFHIIASIAFLYFILFGVSHFKQAKQ